MSTFLLPHLLGHAPAPDGLYLFTVCGTREAREGTWVGYKGNVEIFSQEITSLAETALERILEYRTLADPETAKTIPLISSVIAPFWPAWNQFMTAALAGDIPFEKMPITAALF